MKKNLLFICLVPVLILGCGKKYTCSHSIDYRQPGIAFVGFDKETIKTAVMISYAPNTNFTQAIDTVAIDTSIVFEGDTAYKYIDFEIYRASFYVNEGADYKITLGNPAVEYLISDITSGPKTESATSKNECTYSSHISKIATFNLHVNGKEYTPANKGTDYYFIYLKR